MIQVFSASWCSACKTAKTYLEQNSIPYVERDVDVDQEAREIMERLDLHSIPIIYVDDYNFVVGANLKRITELVKKENQLSE